jgi:Tetratricopeptide repeat
VIEQLLEAERMLSYGLVDNAERLYRQIATHDPKSSIAVVGLARVALERGDERTAYVEARRALAIDPDNPAAQHMVMRLAEVMAGHGETPPDIEDAPAASVATPQPVTPVTPARGSDAESPPAPSPGSAAPKPRPAAPAAARAIVDRILGRRR